MMQVSAGVIVRDGKILICQRPVGKSLAGLWEFPGGKLEAGETLEECLQREIFEELSVEVEVGDFIASSEYKYEHGEFEIFAFFARIIGNAELISNVHQNIAWVKLSELDDYKYPEADLPIIEKLKNLS